MSNNNDDKKKKKVEEPEYFLSPINTQLLNYRIYKMELGEKLVYFMALFVVGGLIGYLFYGGLFKQNGVATIATYISNLFVFALVGIIANMMLMPVINDMLKEKRQSKLKNQFRDFLAALSTSMTSGMNINDSLTNSYNDLVSQYSEESYIAKEVMEIINGINNNISVEDSLANLGYRSGSDDIANFATVFSVCYRTGGNMKEVVKRSSDIISEKIVISEEIKTKLTSNRMQLYAMLAVPVVMMFLMKSMSSQFAESYASVVGVVAITVAVGFFVGAYKIGMRIMDIKG